MAPVPKKKHTNSRSGKRLNAPSKKRYLKSLSRCPSCGKIKEPHKACPNCGYYR